MEEAAALSFDKDPSVVGPKSIAPFVQISAFSREFMDRWDVIQRAAKVGELTDPVSRKDFLSWMRRYDYPLPMRLVTVASRFDEEVPSTEVQVVHEAASDMAAVSLVPETQNLQPTSTVDEDDSQGRYPWATAARAIAEELLPRYGHQNLLQIAEHVEKEMKLRKEKGAKGLTGRGDRVPSADTIKRHALNGLKQ